MAIQEVVKTIKGLGGQEASTEAQELQRLVDGARSMLEKASAGRASPNLQPTAPRVETHHQYNTRSKTTEPRRSNMDQEQEGNNQSAPRVIDRHKSRRSQAVKNASAEPNRTRRAKRERVRMDTVNGPPASRTRLQLARAAAAPPAQRRRQ